MSNRILPLPPLLAVTGSSSSQSRLSGSAESASSENSGITRTPSMIEDKEKDKFNSGSASPKATVVTSMPKMGIKRQNTLHKRTMTTVGHFSNTHLKTLKHASAILNGQEVTERALFYFYPDHPIRRTCIWIANSRWYTNFNLILILINCVVLMIESGRDSSKSGYSFDDLSSALNIIDAMFTFFFALEMFVKIIAGGVYFAGSSSYLRSWWNRLDFIVVCFALANFIPGMQNFTYVRALRLFRPLKAANNLPGLRVMMNAMLAATMTLGNVSLFVFLLLFTFALFGLQIYRDAFRNRCYTTPGYLDFNDLYGFASCSATPFVWDFVGPHLCDFNSTCLDSGTNPYAGTMGYDNILKSWTLSLIVMSGEGWSDIMYAAEDSVSSASWIFFIALACLSNYLAGELLVAVMSVKFEEAKEEEQIKMKEEEEQKQAVREAEKRIREFKKNLKRENKKKRALERKASRRNVNETAGSSNDEAEAAASMETKGGGLARLVGDMETAQVMQLADVIKRQNRQKAAEKAASERTLHLSRRAFGDRPSTASRKDSGSDPRTNAFTSNQSLTQSHYGTNTFNNITSSHLRNQTFASTSHRPPFNVGFTSSSSPGVVSLHSNNSKSNSARSETLKSATRTFVSMQSQPRRGSIQNLTHSNTVTSIPLPTSHSSAISPESQVNANGPFVELSDRFNNSLIPTTSAHLTSLQSTGRSHHKNVSMVSDASSTSADDSNDDSYSRTTSTLDSNSTTTSKKKGAMVLRLQTTFQAASNKWDSVANDMYMPLPAQYYSGLWHDRWYNIRLVCHRLIFSPGSFYLYSAFTALNCAVLACDYWGIDSSNKQLLNDANATFFALFSIELALRLVAIDWEYFKHSYLLLDLITVLLALLDTSFAGNNSTLNSLRAFRVFRMFTVFRHWKAMQRIMRQAHSSIEDLFYFGLVLFLFVFVFAQLGVQIAQNKEDFALPEGPARDNWDSIGWAMIQVFQISTPENWNQVLYDMVQGTGWLGGAFVILTLLVMHYIIESLFVVVMFSHFGTDEEGDREEAEIEAMRNGAVAPIDNVQQLINRVQEADRSQNSDPSTMGSNQLTARTPMTRQSTFAVSAFHNNFEPLSPLNTNTSLRAATFNASINGNNALFPGRSVVSLYPNTRDDSNDSQLLDSPSQAFRETDVMEGNSGAERYRTLNRVNTGGHLFPSSPNRSSLKNRGSCNNDFSTSNNASVPLLPPINTTGNSFISLSPRNNRDLSRSPLHATFTVGVNHNNSSASAFSSIMPAISSRTKGFLGRIARNIEKSKLKKEQEDREREVEKLRQSRSNSRRASKVNNVNASPLHSPEVSQTGRKKRQASFSATHEAQSSPKNSNASTDQVENGGKLPQSGRRRNSVTFQQEMKEVEPFVDYKPSNNFDLSIDARAAEANHTPRNASQTTANAALFFGQALLSEQERKAADTEAENRFESCSAQQTQVSSPMSTASAIKQLITFTSSSSSPSLMPSILEASLPQSSSSTSAVDSHHENHDIMTFNQPLAVDLISAVPLIKASNLPPLRESRVSNVSNLVRTPFLSKLDYDTTKQIASQDHADSGAANNSNHFDVGRIEAMPIVANSEIIATNTSESTAQSSTSELNFSTSQEFPTDNDNKSSFQPLKLPSIQQLPSSALEDTDIKPPQYSSHVKKSRRRFVIAHHSAPSQPWYRQEMPGPFKDRSLFYFQPDDPIRTFLTRLLHSDAWSIGIVGLIIFSCVLLALDYPAMDPNGYEASFLQVADIITTSIYVIEMATRFIVFGAIMGERATLKNGWNVMEFIIVVFSVAALIQPDVSALKALRALRPLRIISRLPGARVVVSSLGKSILNIGNVLVVSFLLLFCLSIVAVELFKGRLQQCLSVPDGQPLAFDQVDCETNQGVWTNPIWTGNYDNIANALLVLFELCTEENWPGTMYTAVDSTEPGFQPITNNNQWYGIFFVVAIIVGSLFIKTLFTATILDGYSLNYAEITGAGGGTSPLQQRWLDFYKLAVDQPPPLSKPRPNTKWFSKWDLKVRRFFFYLAKSSTFEYFFLGVISLNVLALSLAFSGQPLWYENILNVINSICTWLFVVEIFILWSGSGMYSYFLSRSNQFDFVIVILTAYEFFYDQNLVSFHIGFNPSIFRVIRMIRIFKLFSKFPKLVQLGQTVIFSLPALYNVTFLMILEYFIFSVLGVALFGKVKYGYYMTRHGNYQTFTSAMVTLFREMTGENWNGIMRDCMVQPPFCDPSLDECGNTILSPLFHVTFQVLSAMLVMDLIVAIILNQFENQLQKEKRSGDAVIGEREMTIFGEHWAHFSHGKLTMPVSKLPAFLRYLPPPFGFEKKEGQLFGVGMGHYLDELQIPSDGQIVHYLDVVHQLGYRVFLKRYPEMRKMEEDEEETIRDLLSEDEDDEEADDADNLAKRQLESQRSMEMKAAQKTKKRNSSLAQLFMTRVGTLLLSDSTSSSENSKSSVHLPYTAAGIRLANEDLQLITRQAQGQFPLLAKEQEWESYAGLVHRVVICQKLLRGVFDRRRLRDRFVQPLLDQIEKEEEESIQAALTDNMKTPLLSSSQEEFDTAAQESISSSTSENNGKGEVTTAASNSSVESSEGKVHLDQMASSANASISPAFESMASPSGNRLQLKRMSITSTNAASSSSSPSVQTPSARAGNGKHHRFAPSTSSSSPHSLNELRKHSVIAEMMAMRSMSKLHSEERSKGLSSRAASMDIDAMNANAITSSVMVSSTSRSASNSTLLSPTTANAVPPPFKKTPSVPLESTLESDEAEGEHEHGYSEEKPDNLLRLGSSSQLSVGSQHHSKSRSACNNEIPLPFLRIASTSTVSHNGQQISVENTSDKLSTPNY